jgi:hypothetical protein
MADVTHCAMEKPARYLSVTFALFTGILHCVNAFRRISPWNQTCPLSGAECWLLAAAIAGREGGAMLLLLIILVVLLAASAPAWPYSRSWGYYPSGTLGTVLIILIVLMLMGYV